MSLEEGGSEERGKVEALICSVKFPAFTVWVQAVNKRGQGQTFSKSDERTLALFGTHLGNSLAKAKMFEQVSFAYANVIPS